MIDRMSLIRQCMSRLLIVSTLVLGACRPPGTPCVFASSSCAGDEILVTCESSGGGAGSGHIKRTPCGEGSECLEQKVPLGKIASCETLIEKSPCDPQSFASRCEGPGVAILCDTFVTGSSQ